jgi:hypothetical protein
MSSTDAIEHNIYALACEASNFLYEVEMLVIDRDSAKAGNCRRASR